MTADAYGIRCVWHILNIMLFNCIYRRVISCYWSVCVVACQTVAGKLPQSITDVSVGLYVCMTNLPIYYRTVCDFNVCQFIKVFLHFLFIRKLYVRTRKQIRFSAVYRSLMWVQRNTELNRKPTTFHGIVITQIMTIPMVFLINVQLLVYNKFDVERKGNIRVEYL